MAHLLGLMLAAVWAQSPEPPSKPPDEQAQDWRTVLAKRGLAAEDIEKLGRDKLLVTEEAFKQVFVPYTGSSVPVFITSDSLLNAFHVLFEESVRRMEEENARRLPRLLAFLWRGLGTVDEGWKGRPQLVSAAKRRARLVLGTAMTLLGEPPADGEASLAEAIREQAARVEAGEGEGKPAWLGQPDAGFLAIDYSRYRPRGFYAQSEVLSKGAVMPYYEFTHEKRLTDGEWKALLDSPERPSPTTWVAPLLGKEDLGASDEIEDD